MDDEGKIWKTEELINAFAGMALRVAAREIRQYADDLDREIPSKHLAMSMRQRAKDLHKKANEYVPEYNRMVENAANEKLNAYRLKVTKATKSLISVADISGRDIGIIVSALDRSTTLVAIAKENGISQERVRQIIARHKRMIAELARNLDNLRAFNIMIARGDVDDDGDAGA